jgi:L-fucose mutarotase/ribose pyranase (RbsD/FucU family)
VLGSQPDSFFDQRIVAIASHDASRRFQAMSAVEFNPCDLFHNVHKLIDRNELTATDVNGVDDVAVHERLRALHAIVDPREAARSRTV